MFNQYFGNYLLTKGSISTEQLKIAMELQNKTKVKVGVLAIDFGWMNGKQVEEINQLQMSTDKRFGELAIEKNYLSEEQLDTILQKQTDSNLSFGQALVDQGYFDMPQLEQELEQYKKTNQLSDVKLRAMENGSADDVIDAFLGLEETREPQLYKEYISLFARNMVRFIESDFRMERCEIEDKEKICIGQSVEGKHNLFTCLLANEPSSLGFVTRYAKEEMNQLDELAIESFGEFLNLQNGIFTVNQSNQGVELSITPQSQFDGFTGIRTMDLIGIRFFFPFGQVDLVIG